MSREDAFEKYKEYIIKCINNTKFAEDKYPNIKEELIKAAKNYKLNDLNEKI